MVLLIAVMVLSVLVVTFVTLFGLYYDRYKKQPRDLQLSARSANPRGMAIAVSTFMRAESIEQRFVYFKECISSLLASEFPGTIYVVDDCSEVKDHLRWVTALGDPRVVVFEKDVNGGIAKAKNTCIRLCLQKTEVGYFFLSDDDVVFKTSRWFECYTTAVDHTDIQHFSFALPGSARNNSATVTVRGYDVLKTGIVNGCLLMGTRSLVERVGYFKILPHKYGHEHSNYSNRCAKLSGGFYDARDSDQHIELVDGSNAFHSVAFTAEEHTANAEAAAHDDQLYYECVE